MLSTLNKRNSGVLALDSRKVNLFRVEVLIVTSHAEVQQRNAHTLDGGDWGHLS